jgi:mRNA interferase MazF
MTARPLPARGDVLLVRFPFTDLSSTRIRPALVVGRVRGDDLILAFITSRVAGFDPSVEHLLEPSDPEFSRTGLRVASLLRLDRLATLNQNLVYRRLGRIGPRTEQVVANALRNVFDL